MNVISPGEISIGTHLTVLEVNYLDDRRKWNENNPVPIMVLNQMMEGSDYSMYEKLKGIIMRVISIQLPYLAVKILNDAKAPVISIDTRKCVLMELSDDFADSFK